jgi:bifunctional DNase/RNase
MNKLLELNLDKILQTRTYTVVVLKAPEKKFSIYMEPHIGQTLQSFFSNEKHERPQTFDFIDQTLLGLEMKVVRVVLYDLHETTFFSKILYHQSGESLDHLIEVDARPSDSLIIALRHNAPIYCTPKLLEETIAYED